MLQRGQALLTINIDKIETAEYRQAHKIMLRAHRKQVTAAYTSCLFLFFFLVYWLFNHDHSAAGIALAIVVLLLSYFKWLEIRQFQEAARRINENMPIRMTFTEEGILGETEQAEGFRKWDGYDAYHETPLTIVVASTKIYYTVVPKRSLDPGVMADLQRLLQQKLKKL